ncbi:ComF family protein [Sporosarcina limicola]|uniref:Competence protein ComFC n=1 Tax=Sporosarcina limicola TaxID=34101 RepID=A0A927MI01_9BACL|nr:ComF family protein [Sporosarcina limicola]MBE1555005.1 competence protein ComFC [Sporosarcina limicola]
MNECLLCEQIIAFSPSWKGLLGLDRQMNICPNCSKKFKHADIKDEGTILDKITTLYTYNEAMREYLHQFKFLQDVQLAGVFAKELHEHLKGAGTIVPIPMHPEKKIQRTFAHMDELLKSANVSYSNILDKTDTVVMGEKSKEQRLAMKPLFALKPGKTLQSGTYILVDDIYTTGTTLCHAAIVLKEAGATRVEAVTLIRAER